MPATIIARSRAGNSIQLDRSANFGGFPPDQIRQILIAPIANDIVGPSRSQSKRNGIEAQAVRRDGFVAVMRNGALRFVPQVERGDTYIQGADKVELDQLRDRIQIYYDLEGIKSELNDQTLTDDNVLAMIRDIMTLKAGGRLPGFRGGFRKYRGQLERISPYLLYRFESRQMFEMSALPTPNGSVNHLHMNNPKAQQRPFYYNHLPSLQHDSVDWWNLTDRAEPTIKRRAAPTPNAKLTTQGEVILRQKYRAAIKLQLLAAAYNNEGCFLMEPNAFLYGLEANEQKRVKGVYLEEVVNAMREFERDNPDILPQLGKVFVQTSLDQLPRINLRGITSDFYITKGMDSAYPHIALGEGKAVAQPVMGDALGPVGNGALGNRANNGAEENLCRQMPMMLCVMAPQNNENLQNVDWIRGHSYRAVNAQQRAQFQQQQAAQQSQLQQPSTEQQRAQFQQRAAQQRAQEELLRERARLQELERQKELRQQRERELDEEHQQDEQQQQENWPAKESKIPGTEIKATLYTPLIFPERKSIWANTKRGEKFRVIDGVYNDEEKQESIDTTFVAIMFIAAKEVGLTSEEALQAANLAKEKGGVSHAKSSESESYLNKPQTEDKRFVKFSALCQRYAKDCGIYSGRDNGKPVGCRLAFFPDEAVEVFKKLSAKFNNEEFIENVLRHIQSCAEKASNIMQEWQQSKSVQR